METKPERYRKEQGCRLEDKKAVPKNNIEILNIKYECCPGIIVDTPYIDSLYEIQSALDCGLQMSDFIEPPIPYSLVDSLGYLKSIQMTHANLKPKEQMDSE